ncbi:hypothetical protein CI1B_27440 [Bradyrhizobium ivorense]|uniref:Uncharacterized protein n=1 Tax=Bradyrhizobium ivorense TaxID=2511166 RepID=A0A508T9A6_9BRAD|nr:hypothetical protein CI1B_27440 [Bradyrhizobium ivorense]
MFIATENYAPHSLIGTSCAKRISQLTQQGRIQCISLSWSIEP